MPSEARSARVVVALCLAALPALAASSAHALLLPAASVPTAGSRIVAVGDIASSNGRQSLTASLVAARAPQRLIALGDLAYNAGSSYDFATYYQPSYGRFRTFTWPVPGNHEYLTAGAAGFRAYFGVVGPTWWMHRIGSWSVIGLDSEKAASTTQVAFLKAALVSEDGRPTIVVWHRPRFSTGVHGNATDTQTLWATAARDRDVRVVLWGHDHDYERMAVPITTTHTVQAFVVGTGGAELRPFAAQRTSRDVVRIAGTLGVLDLRLRSDGWSWFFVRADGTVADAGSRRL